jgi:hypothetical protein
VPPTELEKIIESLERFSSGYDDSDFCSYASDCAADVLALAKEVKILQERVDAMEASS